EGLHAAHLVDGQADDGEVEAPRRADVAVDDIAEVQRDAEIERRPTLGRAPGVERRVPDTGIDSGTQGLVTHPLGADALRGEDGKEPVAQKLQYFTAMLGDRV